MKIVHSLVASELSDNDKELFNFGKLRGSYFALITVDISFLVEHKNLNESACDLVITKYEELENLLKNNDYFILNFVDQYRMMRIFNILRRFNQNKYFYVSNSKCPENTCVLWSWEGFFYRLDKITSSPMFLVDYIYHKFSRKINTFLFASWGDECDIAIPSFEYDRFTEISAKKNRGFSEDYHVFLDLNIAYHRDIKLTRRKSIPNPTKYYSNLNRFFTELEESTGKEVKIALHPRSDRNENYFGDREVYLNQTAELVSDADIVLGHYSTSNNYPILFHKKLVLLVSDQMTKCDRYIKTKSFADELDIPMLNFDKTYSLQKIDIYINRKRYAEYIDKYIKPRSLTDHKYGYEYINETMDRIVTGRI